MKTLFAILMWLAAALSAASAAPVGEATSLPSGVELPLRVRLAVRVLDILRIAEAAGQGRFYVEVTQRWSDPRLRFDAVATGASRVDRVGEEADAYLKTIWVPGLALDNQVGELDSRTVAVSTYATGEVVLIERYESDFRFRMNMEAFPLDSQELTLSFSLPRYSKQEAILIATEADRQLSGIEPALSVIDWRSARLRFANEELLGWNARAYSRLNVTATVVRQSERYLLRIFVPVLAVLAVSIFVLWSPGLGPNDKGSQIFASLLALAALSFTFEASFPGSISLNTPIAQIISLGYVYLVIVLLLDVWLSKACADPNRRFHPMLVELRRQVRWALPALMAIVCIGAAVRAIPS